MTKSYIFYQEDWYVVEPLCFLVLEISFCFIAIGSLSRCITIAGRNFATVDIPVALTIRVTTIHRQARRNYKLNHVVYVWRS